MGFDLTDFSPLQVSLHDIARDVPIPDFSAAVEKSQQAVSQSVSLLQEVQPKNYWQVLWSLVNITLLKCKVQYQWIKASFFYRLVI